MHAGTQFINTSNQLTINETNTLLNTNLTVNNLSTFKNDIICGTNSSNLITLNSKLSDFIMHNGAQFKNTNNSLNIINNNIIIDGNVSFNGAVLLDNTTIDDTFTINSNTNINGNLFIGNNHNTNNASRLKEEKASLRQSYGTHPSGSLDLS